MNLVESEKSPKEKVLKEKAMGHFLQNYKNLSSLIKRAITLSSLQKFFNFSVHFLHK